MMLRTADQTCACGHPSGLHDRHGCAAFLGSFDATSHDQRYCSCKIAHPRDLRTVPAARGPIVATVTLRERRGSAIAVCDSPPVLELGPSGEAVLEAVKARLRAILGPPSRADERLRVIRGAPGMSEESLELLR